MLIDILLKSRSLFTSS